MSPEVLAITTPVALALSIIGLAVGGLCTLYCLVVPFLARRQHFESMGLLWLYAVLVLILNGLTISALISLPFADNHVAFATLSDGFYAILLLMVAFVSYQHHKQQKKWRTIDIQIQNGA